VAVIKGLSIDYSKVSDAWERGDPYEQYVGRWSRLVAPRFLSWLGIPAGSAGRMLGVVRERYAPRYWICSPFSVVGVDPSEGFLEKAKDQLAGRVVLHRGSAVEIPLWDASVDAAVSGLVLNFVPNGNAALAEMARVTVSGGTIGAYVWDYAGKMDLMRFFGTRRSNSTPTRLRWTKESDFRYVIQRRLLIFSRTLDYVESK